MMAAPRGTGGTEDGWQRGCAAGVYGLDVLYDLYLMFLWRATTNSQEPSWSPRQRGS